MRLVDKQKIFASLIARFVTELFQKGYEVTLGECYRPQEVAELYAKAGKGIVDSLHGMRLASDLNLFKDGRYLTSTCDYAEAGSIWKTYSTDEYECCWGGEFQDGNHFSIEHEGRR